MFNTVAFLVIVFLTFVLALKKLRYGIYIAAAELIVGSYGYLFSLNFGMGNTLISIRMGIFAAVMFSWVVNVLKHGGFRDYWCELNAFEFFRYYLYLAAVLAWGFIWGIIRGNDFGNVFLDFNNWLFFLYLLPLLSIKKQADGSNRRPEPENLETCSFVDDPNVMVQSARLNQRENKQELSRRLIVDDFWHGFVQIVLAALCWLIIKTFILLYIFSHQFIWALPEVYQWIRDTRVGEITMISNNFYRIFLQSQIYALLAFFILLPISNFQFPISNKNSKFKIQNSKFLFLLIGCLSAVIISFSRSFWLGLIGGLCVYFLYLIFYGLRITDYGLRIKILIGQVFKLFGAVAISFSIIFLIVNLPPKIAGKNLSSLISKRTTEIEAAGSSRLNMLKPLGLAIIKHPLIGSGFGATATYQSADPRILTTTAVASGEYTTYAFEWAYLDLLLKIGLVGLAIYLLLIYKVLQALGKQIKNFEIKSLNFDSSFKLEVQNSDFKIESKFRIHTFKFGLMLAFISLLIVNIFTPYLNHPLGIGAVILVSAFLDKGPINGNRSNSL